MTSLLNETVLSLEALAARLPDRVHRTTLRRWAQEGVDGVRLEAVRLGRRWYSSVEALARFSERLTAGSR